jgi:putative flippase GtrA
MLRVHHFIKDTILDIVDFFYPMFKKFMPLQTFRYAACGGANTVIDISLFFVSYNYIFKQESLYFPSLNLTIGAHIAAFLVSFCVTFPIGFYLSRYVVFQETSVAKSEQLGKYFSVVMFCLILNYGFLKLFVDVFRWYPTPSKVLTTFFVVMFSYVSQKNFTFKAADKTN